MISARVEAIVAGGRCDVGTSSGNFYALIVADGTTEGRFKGDGPIGHSASYTDGRL